MISAYGLAKKTLKIIMKILLMIIFVINCRAQHFISYIYPMNNSCDLPVFDQISLLFYTKNLKSPGFENFRLTGLQYLQHPILWVVLNISTIVLMTRLIRVQSQHPIK